MNENRRELTMTHHEILGIVYQSIQLFSWKRKTNGTFHCCSANSNVFLYEPNRKAGLRSNSSESLRLAKHTHKSRGDLSGSLKIRRPCGRGLSGCLYVCVSHLLGLQPTLCNSTRSKATRKKRATFIYKYTLE